MNEIKSKKLSKPAWKLTQKEVFSTRVVKVYIDGYVMYNVVGFPRDPVPYQRAWDRCMYDSQYGHFAIICTALSWANPETLEDMPIENILDYYWPLKRFFTKTATGLKCVSRSPNLSAQLDHTVGLPPESGPKLLVITGEDTDVTG